MTKGTYRVVTGVTLGLLVGLLVALHRATPDAWSGVVVWGAALCLSVLGAREIPRMTAYRELGLSPALPLAALAAGAVQWPWREELSSTPQPWLGLLAAVGIAAAVAALLAPRARMQAAVFAVWSAAPLYGLVAIDRVYGVSGLVALVLLSKIGDIFGYFVGKAIGRRRPFPKLSPNKTLAGCVASLVAGAVTGASLGALGWLPLEGGLFVGALSGLALNVAAQAADLYESKVKRRGEVKDSGTLCAAAGGVLDVVDSLLFTVPVALVLWPALLG